MTSRSDISKKHAADHLRHLRKLIDIYVFVMIFGAYPLSMLLIGNGQLVIASLIPALFLLPLIGVVTNVRVQISAIDGLLMLFLCYLIFNALAISQNEQSVKLVVKFAVFYLASYSLARILLEQGANLQWRLFFAIAAIFFIFFHVFIQYGSIRIAYVDNDVAFGAISNWMPALLLPIAPLVFFPQTTPEQPKWLNGANMMMFIAIILLSQSRFGYLLLLLILLWQFASLELGKKVFFVLAGLTALLIMTSLFQFDLMQLAEPVIKRSAKLAPILLEWFDIELQNTLVEAESTRSIMLSKALEVWKENPVFGIGFNGMADIPLDESNHAHAATGIISHNLYLATGLGELGLVGFALLMSIVLLALIIPLRRRKGIAAVELIERRRIIVFWFGLVIALLHGYLRPQLDNPVFFTFLVMAGWGFGTNSYIDNQNRGVLNEHPHP